jgi:DNA-binding transcriptional ArsR family regulator
MLFPLLPSIMQTPAALRALAALAHPVRLEILRQLGQPRQLSDLSVRQPGSGRPLARQTLRQHLDRLVACGLVERRAAGARPAYVLDPRGLFLLSESFCDLASLRAPTRAPAPTLHAAEGGPQGTVTGFVLVRGLHQGRLLVLPRGRGRWTVGRSAAADVVLDFDPYVSSRHAEVEATPSGFLLRDLPGNKNGTMLNFAPMARGSAAPLGPGDVVGVGRSLLLFRTAPAAGPPASAWPSASAGPGQAGRPAAARAAG